MPAEKIGLPWRITVELVGVGISAKRGGELGHGLEECSGVEYGLVEVVYAMDVTEGLP